MIIELLESYGGSTEVLFEFTRNLSLDKLSGNFCNACSKCFSVKCNWGIKEQHNKTEAQDPGEAV